MTRRREGNPAPAATPAPAPPQSETNPAHETIRAHLARIGVTHDDHVGAALDAHDDGLDVQAVIDNIKAGMPHWLAILLALHRWQHGDYAAGSSPSGSGQSPIGTGAGGT